MSALDQAIIALQAAQAAHAQASQSAQVLIASIPSLVQAAMREALASVDPAPTQQQLEALHAIAAAVEGQAQALAGAVQASSPAGGATGQAPAGQVQ